MKECKKILKKWIWIRCSAAENQIKKDEHARQHRKLYTRSRKISDLLEWKAKFTRSFLNVGETNLQLPHPKRRHLIGEKNSLNLEGFLLSKSQNRYYNFILDWRLGRHRKKSNRVVKVKFQLRKCKSTNNTSKNIHTHTPSKEGNPREDGYRTNTSLPTPKHDHRIEITLSTHLLEKWGSNAWEDGIMMN